MASKIAMTSLDGGLSLISTIGNGSFIAIFVRFKNLRNFPNILLANLAAVDFLNAVINVPMHTLNYVWKSSWMKGKTPAVILSSLQLEFALLNMVSMFAIMLDRFLALYLDLKYYTWKTTRKAYAAVALIWLICTVHVALSTIPLLKMDMEADTTLGKSREKIFQQRKGMIASTMGFFIAASTAFGVLTVYTIYQNKRKVGKNHINLLTILTTKMHVLWYCEQLWANLCGVFSDYSVRSQKREKPINCMHEQNQSSREIN